MTLITQEIILNEARNVRLHAMVQSVNGEFAKISARPAVLILPGGGYSMCSDREAEVIAYPYLQAGYHAFVLRYSIQEHKKWPNPLNDCDQAMELIRSKADEWSILSNKIAVIGFSAGGHLAACAATMAKNRPNAAILGYAALEKELIRAMHPEEPIPVPGEHIDSETCPCFLFAARDDTVVPIRNSVRFEDLLIDHGIQFESHIYAYGGHGFGNGEPNIAGTTGCRRIPNWTRDSIGWLEDIFGRLTPEGLGEPACKGHINGNWEDTLSLDCTIKHLKKQTGQAEQILAGAFGVIEQIVKAMFGESALISGILAEMTLGDVLKMVNQMPAEQISQLDAALLQIPNQK